MSLPAVTGGTLYGVGIGPGEPEYLTLRARHVIEHADLIAYFCKSGGGGQARAIVAPFLDPGRAELPLIYPVTIEAPVGHADYDEPIARFYAQSAQELAGLLAEGRSIALLSEGDPFFYGSFMHIWRRLRTDHRIEIVPGVTGMAGCWARAGAPISWGDDVVTVLPGTLDEARLRRHLGAADAFVIMKLGRNFAKVRDAIAAAGLLSRAIYVERGTMAGEIVLPLAEKCDDAAPYFSMILIPGQGRAL